MVAIERSYRWSIHPVHAVLLAGTVTLFLGALLGDFAYSSSFQIQWTNFASWLIVGGLVFATVVLAWAVVDLVRGARGGQSLAYLVLLLAIWVLGFINALVHAKDAWATMPAGLVLSVIVAVLACAATWLGFASVRVGVREGARA